MLQCKKRMRDIQLWFVHGMGRWNTGSFLFYTGHASGRKKITTLEGVQKEAEEFAQFLGGEGAEQCGFCSPGFVMNVLAMVRELEDPTEEDIKEYLAGNLCRCTGYAGQLRAIQKYLAWKKNGEA